MTTLASTHFAQELPDEPIRRQRWAQPLAWIVALACCVAGVYGLMLRFDQGHAAAAYGSYVPWGLWIAAYVAFIGSSAGAFAFAAVVLMVRQEEYYPVARLAILVALAAFAVGMTNVWLDLGHPLRAWKLLLQTSWTSIMGWMSWFYVLYGLMLLLGLVASIRGQIPAFVQRWAFLAFLFAILFAGAEGALFGVIGARAVWESGLTPILFLAEAGLFGIGLVMVTAFIFNQLSPRIAQRLGTVALIFLGIVVVLEWAEYSTGLYAAVPAKSQTLQTILAGPYWWVFWGLHLGLGIVVPALLLFFGRGKVLFTAIAGGLIASMGLATKLNLVIPALAQEELEGLAHAFTGPGLTFAYFPSFMEWLVWLGTLGLGGMIVLLGYWVFGLAKTTTVRK